MLRGDAAWEATILHQFEFLFLGQEPILVLCSLFGVLYFRLEIIFLFRVLGFRSCLYAFFLGFCTSISGFWVFVLYYGHKSDWNGAYERRVIKVLINVWNCIFKSSQWFGQFYFPWQFIPFCNCPWVEGILVVIPNGCRQCVRVL